MVLYCIIDPDIIIDRKKSIDGTFAFVQGTAGRSVHVTWYTFLYQRCIVDGDLVACGSSQYVIVVVGPGRMRRWEAKLARAPEETGAWFCTGGSGEQKGSAHFSAYEILPAMARAARQQKDQRADRRVSPSCPAGFEKGELPRDE